MFRLRFYCPFGGRGGDLLWIGTVIVAISTILTACNGGNIIAAIMIPAFLTLIGGYLWLNRITDLDSDNMEKAEAPLWHPLTADERVNIIESKAFNIFLYIILYAIALLFLILPPKHHHERRESYPDEITIMITIIAVIVISFIMIWDYVNSLKWRTIDDTAVCTEIPVYIHFSVEHNSGRRRYTDDYIVIYLPDGKYVLPSKLAGSQTVKIVKFKGMLGYYETDVDEKSLAWSNVSKII